jgi:uncharacterized protein (DUF2344 family)
MKNEEQNPTNEKKKKVNTCGRKQECEQTPGNNDEKKTTAKGKWVGLPQKRLRRFYKNDIKNLKEIFFRNNHSIVEPLQKNTF